MIRRGERRQRQSCNGTSPLISPRLPTLCGVTEASTTELYSTKQPFSPHGGSLSPLQPRGICFIRVRFAWHAECFAGDETYEWDQCFHIMSQACLSVWWLMTPIPVKVSAQGPNNPPTQHTNTNCLTRQTQTEAWARNYGLNVCVLTYWAPCCLIQVSINHYKWKAKAGVNTTLEIRGPCNKLMQEVVGLFRVSNGGMPLWDRCRAVWFSNMTL